jgi:hypothetical protein
MALPGNDKALIKNLSRPDVEATMATLKRFLANSRWIGKTNRYATDVVDRLKKDNPLNASRQSDLARYIVVSSVLHANDGWSYLGRAVSALMAGDPHRALHLAYYAELRAAMALFASIGIGIFDKKHFVISGPCATTPLIANSGTHRVAWDILELWSKQRTSGALFANLIRPGGRSLDDWFQPHGGATVLSAQARQWFEQWGMDLSFAAEDRDVRNDSSYRPDGFPISWIVSPADILAFVEDLWSVLQPSALSSFEEVDRHILRLALESFYRGRTGSQPPATDAAYLTFIQATVAAQNFLPETAERWVQFLLRTSVKGDPLIFLNSALKPGKPESDHLAVVSRAVLLLRLATGATRNLLHSAGFHSSNLTFWWQEVGVSRGLWDPASPPLDLADLWADIDDALIDVTSFRDSTAVGLQSGHRIMAGVGHRFSVLASHERVGLWSLCSS